MRVDVINLLSVIAVISIIAGNSANASEYTEEELRSGKPIAVCMAENDWASSAVPGPVDLDFRSIVNSVSKIPSSTTFIDAPKFDAIASCIDAVYLLGQDGITYKVELWKPTQLVDFSYSSNRVKDYYVRTLYYNPVEQRPINAIILNNLSQVYKRSPDFPGLCDNIQDATSKKWCTGELSARATSNHCTNSYGDPCGSKYIQTITGYRRLK